LQRIGLIVDEVAEVVGLLSEYAPGLRLAHFFLELALDRLELWPLASVDLIELDHVIAELRFDRPRDLADFHVEYGVIERLHHPAAREETEIAAFGRGARVLRGLLGKLRERFGGFLRFRQQRLSLLLGLCFLLRRRVRRHRNQDMAR